MLGTTGTSRWPAARQVAADVLDACKREVEPAMRAAVDTLPDPVRHIAGYHLGWWEPDGRPSQVGGGKAIRPALTLTAAAGVGGATGVAVPAAVAVELVHNFSLLHDDVMDRDTTRRHRPTAWSVFGASPAILAGDALLTLAMDVLAASPAGRSGVRVLSAAVQELVDGQIADLDFEQRSDVGIPECLHMAECKTGALLGAACALGAAAGGGSPAQVQELDRFGRDLGVAFQFVDDLLGIWGDPATTGKPVRNDLRCRKKSLPVVAALRSGTPAARELDLLYHRKQQFSDAELEHVAGLVELAGGRAWSKERAAALLAGALSRLGTAAPGADAQLRALAETMVRRDR
ncbi:family 2 encapsulin nanocompartment cargo protein polyprenyl transferase [Pseudonocardia sp. GCM10023141]|uniref:family 2 encapsulin nanocompartment cargo protein polyprenyl transferase n=1 Tax=Pseudonocardia sp. GCM10023141 TaxID=3252653 RepID=UPI00361BFA48